MLQKRSLTCRVVHEMTLRRTSLTNVRTISTVSSVWPVEVRPECSQSSTYVSPRLNQASYSEVCVLLMALPPKAVLLYRCVSDTFFPSQKQISRRMCRSFHSATGKSRIAINTHKINTRWALTPIVMAAKLPRLIQMTATLRHLVTENCNTCSGH